MLDILIGVPPIIHSTTATSGDVVGLILGLLVVFVLAAIGVAWAARKGSIERRQSQIKEVELQNEAFPQPRGGEQPQVHAPEEEKVLLPR